MFKIYIKNLKNIKSLKVTKFFHIHSTNESLIAHLYQPFSPILSTIDSANVNPSSHQNTDHEIRLLYFTGLMSRNNGLSYLTFPKAANKGPGNEVAILSSIITIISFIIIFYLFLFVISIKEMYDGLEVPSLIISANFRRKENFLGV